MSQERTYWRSIGELTNHADFIKNAGQEFNLPTQAETEETPGGHNRRDFLKLMGFGVATATLASCEAPVRKAIPYLSKPEQLDPSVPNWYASTYMEDGEYAPIIVKTREGRPIKVEGNPLSSITRGGSSVKVQASLLSLYDQTRYRNPLHKGKDVSWEEADRQIGEAIRTAAAQGKGLRLVTPTIASPTFNAVVQNFAARYPGFQHVVFDAISYSGLIKANGQSFGQAVVPTYDFSRAQTIVSFDADFLGTWVSPIEFAKQFSKNRKLGKQNRDMSRFYMFEPLMSLTGANADSRTVVKASAIGQYVAALQAEVAALTGGQGSGVTVAGQALLKKVAGELAANRGRTLVVCGSNDANVQTIVNSINYMLGNYGTTINLSTPNATRTGTEEASESLLADLQGGRVGVVMFYKANPLYNHPQADALKKALGGVTTVSLSCHLDETSNACEWVAPDSHFLESWGDAEPRRGYYSLMQPTITPLFKTRQAAESLMAWGGMGNSYYDFIKGYWRANLFGTQNQYASFNQFWNNTLHDGVYEVGRPSLRGIDSGSNGGLNSEAAYKYLNPAGAVAPVSFNGNVASAASSVGAASGAGLELLAYEKVAIGNGNQTNNPWLLELPDPISRATWENYVTISPAKAKELDLQLEDVFVSLVKLTVNGKSFELPAIMQPGQEKNTIGIALGFGRTITGPAGKDKGVNIWPALKSANGSTSRLIGTATIEKISDGYKMGFVQTTHTYMGRPVVQESTLAAYKKDATAGRFFPKIETPNGKVKATDQSIWITETNKRPNHAWGMMVDLNSCIGCGACVLSCNVENNIPVVGKDEVVNRREMHWIRIDRYYSSESEESNASLERAAENPQVVFQPMMCQHCNNAPCETVCPVLATTHSSEGLNQMTYNRCIGTRYCANNCPYKVRRFNWFSYPQNKENFPLNPANDALTRMVLNPDVTVRARGVMEKCSFCIQRIQDGKLNAKKEGRRPVDGEITTACAQACPADAIVFGDMNDPESRVTMMINEQYDERAFKVLEEINTKPSVGYLTKIRNI